MNMNALVSFIIPAYNAGNTIKRCILAVSKVPYCGEIIVVDDGSIDNTSEIVKSISDSRIKYIKQQNRGVSAARNAGIKVASCRYIGFSDADDIVTVDSAEKVMEQFSTSPEMIVADFREYHGTTVVERHLNIEEGSYGKELTDQLSEWMLNYPIGKNFKKPYIGGKIYQYYYNKQFLMKNNILFDERVVFAEDMCFLQKCFYYCQSISYISVNIYDYYVIAGSASHKYRSDFWYELKNTYNALQKTGKDFVVPAGVYYYFSRIAIHNYVKGHIPAAILKQKICEILSDKQIKEDTDNLQFDEWTICERLKKYLITRNHPMILVCIATLKNAMEKLICQNK